MSDCLFCKIIAKTIPADFIFEDDKIVAFLDINPVNPGHLLIMPKTHVENLMDLPDDLCLPLAKVMRRAMRVMMRNLGYDGVNLIQNNGTAAGQVIPHLHCHVIPRKTGDGHVHWHGHGYENGQATLVAAKLREDF